MEESPQNISAAEGVPLTACPDCDLLLPVLQPPKGHKTQCPRCGRILLHHCRETVLRSLALALSGILLFFPAMLLPLMTFQRLGLSESGNLLQTILAFIDQGYYFVALAVFLTAVLFPLLKLSLLAAVSLCLKLCHYPRFLGRLFRAYNHLGEWAMLEVYLLGIMITIIKMGGSTEISFNLGFLCFTAMVVISLASSLTVCKESFWRLIESGGKQSLPAFPVVSPESVPDGWQSAAAMNMLLCRECGKLSRVETSDHSHRQQCSRCLAPLHSRKPAALARTWALILTAAILMFPANLLPIMRVDFLGVQNRSTIMDGIKLFFQDGSYVVAVIILTASILIPILKIVGLAIALLTIQFKRVRFLRQKTMMFRFIEFIGRWSMLDIFVIALLASYVNFGFLSTIAAAPAATYFCLVVITTMFAALTFDPRQMWDLVPTLRSEQSETPRQGEHFHEA